MGNKIRKAALLTLGMAYSKKDAIERLKHQK